MVVLRIVRRLLLGVSLGCMGCVTVPDPPQAAQSTPTETSRLDRLLRRTSVPATAQIPEAPRDPKDPGRLSLSYAQLMERTGDLGQAESHYQRALEQTPESLEAIVGLGRVHVLSGRLNAAEEAFHRALKADPDFAPALYGLGQVAAARKQWTEAAELLDAAVLAEPDNNSFRYDLAVALVEAGQVDAALPHFIRTVGDAEAHYNAGLILQRAGRLAESEQQLRLALSKNPQLEQAQYWLDTIQAQQRLPSGPPARDKQHGPAVQQVSFESAQR